VDQVAPGSPQVARLANGQLVSSILDVAWNGWGLGDHLLRWLDDMALDKQPTVHERAAMIAGQLSLYDFDHVVDRLIEPWVRSRSVRLRDAAGWSMLAASHHPELHQQLRLRMREWTRNGTVYARDSVAFGYLHGIGHKLPYEGLGHLRLVAEDLLQRRSYLVAHGVDQTYEASRAEAVIGELVTWGRTGRERVQLHAARAFLLIARRATEPPGPQSLELPRRMRSGDVQADQVAELWVLALSYPGTAALAWRVLTFWLFWPDREQEVADQVLEVIASLATVPEMKARLSHQLVHVWREQRPSNPLLPAIATTLGEA
jgi:hypothetical protein